MFLRTFSTALLTVLLTGCVALSTPELEQSWQGRFSVTAQSELKNENHSGRFSLTRSGTELTVLDLKTSLGNTIARITQTPEDVSLESVGASTLHANNAEDLLIQTLGFSVPVEGLQFWIDGAVIPGVESVTDPSVPPYKHIKQNGWTIDFESYDANGFPKRIKLLRNSSEQAPMISIILLISHRDHVS